MKLTQLFERDLDKLAAVETLNNGKSYAFSKGDLGLVIGCLRYYAGFADKLEGRVIDTDSERLNYVKHEPVSVVVVAAEQILIFI
jgi:aldehyde dehydrogenase (NAD+)